MFDNIKPADDMFDGVETGAAPAPVVSQPVSVSAPSVPDQTPTTSEALTGGKSFNGKPIIIVVAIIFIVGTAATIAYFLLASREDASPAVSEAEVTPVTETEPSKTEEKTPVVTPPVVVTPPSDEVDRDKDGLSDQEEKELGTSPTNKDTDADGLFDKEEVKTYKTDPLDPDTDGDTYQDGAEVKGGYDPNGPGKLFEVPKE